MQVVCVTRPLCLCVGADEFDLDQRGDECACRVPVAGARVCMDCSARLEVIDVDTGEPVERGA